MKNHIRKAFELVAEAAENGQIPDHQYDQTVWGSSHDLSDLKRIAAKYAATPFSERDYHCGTAQCVGGWVETLLRVAGRLDTNADYNAWSAAFAEGTEVGLFASYPMLDTHPTVKDMGRAIRAFLRGSSDPWSEAKRGR